MSYCPFASITEGGTECNPNCAWRLENGQCAIRAIGEYCLANCQDDESYDEDSYNGDFYDEDSYDED